MHILVVYMPISTSMYRFALCTTLLVLKGAVLAEHLGADGRTVEVLFVYDMTNKSRLLINITILHD